MWTHTVPGPEGTSGHQLHWLQPLLVATVLLMEQLLPCSRQCHRQASKCWQNYLAIFHSPKTILLHQKTKAETEEGRYHPFPHKVLQISRDHWEKEKIVMMQSVKDAISQCRRSSEALHLSWTKNQLWPFSLHIHCPQVMLHFALWTLMDLRFLKSHFVNVPINIQSFKVWSHPATSGNRRKDLLHVETLWYSTSPAHAPLRI